MDETRTGGTKSMTATHNVMDNSVSIKLTHQQLEELLYEKGKKVALSLDVDGETTEITIEKNEDWK